MCPKVPLFIPFFSTFQLMTLFFLSRMFLFIILQMLISDWIRTLFDVITLLESKSNIAVNWFINSKMIVNPDKF